MFPSNSLLESAHRWHSLGIQTVLLEIAGEHGSKKLIRKAKKVEENLFHLDSDSLTEFNFLAVMLSGSGLVCIDVDPATPDSVSNFYSWLLASKIQSSDLLMESTLNGGLHLYFRLGDYTIPTIHFCSWKGICFDLLTDKRIFTSPSSFGPKKYAWLHGGFEKVSKLTDIPSLPSQFFGMLSDHKKYKV